MRRTLHRLNALAVSRATKPGLYSDGGGLYLAVSKAGVKSWIFRYRVASGERAHGLGPLHTVSLKQARERALVCRQQRLDGIDPIEAKRAARTAAAVAAAKTATFRECAERYITAHRDDWSNPKHAKQWSTTLETYVHPVIGEMPVRAVELDSIIKVLDPIWKTKTTTASRVRGRIESVLDWATVRGFRSGENPARWKGHLEELFSSGKRATAHLAALDYREISAFMDELRQQEGIAARALEFAILTAARAGSVIEARWEEIDLKARTWTVPAERMKARREHRYPLSEAATAIPAELWKTRSSQFVFPGAQAGRPMNAGALLIVLRGMGRADIVPHGFRSTFRDWAAEVSNFPHEVCEMTLAHTVASAVERAYRRGDLFEKRRQLAESWARYCKPGTAKVVSIGSR
jgi:integrase